MTTAAPLSTDTVAVPAPALPSGFVADLNAADPVEASLAHIARACAR